MDMSIVSDSVSLCAELKQAVYTYQFYNHGFGIFEGCHT